MFGPTDDMIPKIADFGVAKLISPEVMTHSTVGQEPYMAPEVRVHLQYNLTADIFSLAMTLFEIFNEQLTRKSSDEVKRFIAGMQTGTTAKIPDSCKVPLYLRNVIERGLNTIPEERPTLSDYRNMLHGKHLISLFTT